MSASERTEMDRDRLRSMIAYVRTGVIGLPRRKGSPVEEFILHLALAVFIGSIMALIFKLVTS